MAGGWVGLVALDVAHRKLNICLNDFEKEYTSRG